MHRKINNINFSYLIYLCSLVVTVLIFTKYYYLLTNEFYPPAFAEKVANFEAEKVFQKRFLFPVTAGILSHLLPLEFDKSLKILTALSTFGLLYYFKDILNIFCDGFPNPFWSLLLLIPVSWNYMFINSIYHAYDIPTLFFYCACLSFFLNKKYISFYIVFIIATFNRESTCFITISIAILFTKFNTNSKFLDNCKINIKLIQHLFFQTLIWILLLFLINWITKKSPGQTYEITYSMKVFFLNMWNNCPSWPFLNTATFFGNPRCFLTLFACLWLVIPFLWNHIPVHCKKLLLLIPIYITPALLYANIMETRVYHELNVVITLAIAAGIIHSKNSWKLITWKKNVRDS